MRISVYTTDSGIARVLFKNIPILDAMILFIYNIYIINPLEKYFKCIFEGF